MQGSDGHWASASNDFSSSFLLLQFSLCVVVCICAWVCACERSAHGGQRQQRMDPPERELQAVVS